MLQRSWGSTESSIGQRGAYENQVFELAKRRLSDCIESLARWIAFCLFDANSFHYAVAEVRDGGGGSFGDDDDDDAFLVRGWVCGG